MNHSNSIMPTNLSTSIKVADVVQGEMALAISQHALEKLLKSGVLNASDLRPLTTQTKNTIQKQCLKGCQGHSCTQCIFQKVCEFS